jgi:hypothetical protein
MRSDIGYRRPVTTVRLVYSEHLVCAQHDIVHIYMKIAYIINIYIVRNSKLDVIKWSRFLKQS